MGNFNIYPTTILGKVRTRTPTQAQSLSSRYVFLNVKNAEPNLGCPPDFYGGTYASSLTSEQYQGVRYALLSNNHSGSAWRVWAYDNPKIATYSKESSIALGDNAFPINFRSFVYSNYVYGNQNNRYNSQSFSRETFNVFSLSGIYLFNATTIGDPASAIEFIVTEEGKVGIGVEDPAEKLTVNGNISANGSLFVRDLSASSLTISGNISASGNLTINGNTVLGDTTSDETIIRGTVKIADSDSDAIVFGTNNGSYDTNLYRSAANVLKTDDSFEIGINGGKSTFNLSNTNTDVGLTIGGDTNLYRSAANVLKTDDSFIVEGDTFLNGNVTLGNSTSDVITFSGAPVRFPNATTQNNALKIGNDVNLFRSGTSLLQIDNGVNITGTLDVNENAVLSGNVTLGDSFSDNLIINCSSFVKSPLSSNSSGFFGSTLTVDSSVSASGGITVGRTTITPGTSAATLVNATTASTLTLTDIFLKINIGGKDYALPLYEYTT